MPIYPPEAYHSQAWAKGMEEGPQAYDAQKSGLTQVFWEPQMRSGDRVINTAIGEIGVRSGNLETMADPDYTAARCVLRELGFTLPATRNGVHWAEMAGVEGYTVIWEGFIWHRISYSFVAVHYQRSSMEGKTESFNEFAITLYHEVKGHNRDNVEDGPAFDQIYEKPIYDAVAEARRHRVRLPACSKDPNAGRCRNNRPEHYYCICKVKY
jgi:hypothetical protein